MPHCSIEIEMNKLQRAEFKDTPKVKNDSAG